MGEDESFAVDDTECVDTSDIIVPPRQDYVFADKSPEHEQRDIIRYMSLEADGEIVIHLEKMTTTTVAGERYDVWDVHTDKRWWWVITNLLNLYEQSTFASMDMCLTFHVGLMSRMNQTDSEPDEAAQTLLRVSRQLDAANGALPEATEPEDFQAIGVKLRETLLSYVRELSSVELVPAGAEEPKLGDVIHWSELIVDNLATDGLEKIRPLMRGHAKELWQLVNGLTHSRSAERPLAEMAVASAYHFLIQTLSIMRAKDRAREQTCPQCDSRRLFREYRKLADDSWQYFLLCTVCEWERPDPDIDGT